MLVDPLMQCAVKGKQSLFDSFVQAVALDLDIIKLLFQLFQLFVGAEQRMSMSMDNQGNTSLRRASTLGNYWRVGTPQSPEVGWYQASKLTDLKMMHVLLN